MGTVARRWNLLVVLAQRLQQLETQVGQQRAVIEHQQEQLMRQQTTIDAERAARTPVNPAQDARINLVDLRVGNKRETLAVGEKLCAELADVEANPLRELFLPGMSDVRKNEWSSLRSY